jgi:hypothetical protein
MLTQKMAGIVQGGDKTQTQGSCVYVREKEILSLYLEDLLEFEFWKHNWWSS